MKPPILLAFTIGFTVIQSSLCIFDPLSIGIGSAGVGLLTVGYQKYVKCRYYECCNDKYVIIDVRELQRQLATRLHGQHIAQISVMRAFYGRKATEEPPKALTVSFHGTVGTGKNFVARIIAETFYKKGLNSQYYHLFSGSSYLSSRLDQHKDTIRTVIVESLQKCEMSMFVFDEVDMMPEGLLDVLLPFMDYSQPIFVEHESRMVRLIGNKAVFIFLSNKGSSAILNQAATLQNSGRSRESMTIYDFEPAITAAAYSEAGGFLKSNAIETSLIDYFVPFLPLEEEHVRACLRDAFVSRMNETPTTAMENEIMKVVTYFDPPHNLYSKSGCKRLEQKVISAAYEFQPERKTIAPPYIDEDNQLEGQG